LEPLLLLLLLLSTKTVQQIGEGRVARLSPSLKSGQERIGLESCGVGVLHCRLEGRETLEPCTFPLRLASCSTLL
jgi:hypothetical protein